MNAQYTTGNDAGEIQSLFSSFKESLTEWLRPLVSKRAQKAYVGIFLFITASIVMILVSAFAYGIFYYRFIPQVGMEREVHLQFGDGHPWGIATIGSGLISRQAYDVSVELDLPRTPSNLATGNFMVDLALLPQSPTTAMHESNSSTHAISQSRRPAILTFNSRLVDTASKLTFIPFYVTGWQREAERLHITMMEGIEFARGSHNLPGSLRLEIQSQERMQFYGAKVSIKARFSGLRWIMYKWRLTSFTIFAFLFWSTSMASASMVWMLLATLYSSSDDKAIATVKAENDRGKSIKPEPYDESTSPFAIPSSSRSGGKIKKEEEYQADDENGDSDTALPGPSGDAGIGTGLENTESRGIQRRRSHQFQHDDHSS